MKFNYKSIKNNGELVEGSMVKNSRREALSELSSRGLRPVSLKIDRKNIWSLNFFKKKINLEDLVFLTRYLALMLRVGTDLFKAIDILLEDFDKPAVHEFLLETRKNIEDGKPFYTTFGKYPNSFSKVFVSLVKAGEVSGNLQEVFEQLSESLEKQHQLTQKIKSALTYPIILMVASVLVLILMVSYSLPKVARVFMTGGMNPPAFSKAVFTAGLYMGDHLSIILTVFVFIIVGGGLFFMKTMVGKRTMYDIALRVPVIRKIIKQSSLQMFATTLSSLLNSGLPITEALEITADSVGMPSIREALLRISNEYIKKGITVGEAFRKEPAFPMVVSNLIAVSEKSGHLEEILKTLGNFYEGEIGSAVKSMVAFIEPIMLLFIGVVIGGIALAVIIPVYQLSASI